MKANKNHNEIKNGELLIEATPTYLKEIWDILLQGHSWGWIYEKGKKGETKKILVHEPIIYANNDAKNRAFDDQIKIEDLQTILLKKRAEKAKEDQKNRTRQNAEVFTPLWICNKQNDLVDQEWFAKKSDLFLLENQDKLNTLLKQNGWDEFYQKYILLPRMEITCGEAPYLVSRYDVTDGTLKIQPIAGRVGLLDRKLRIIDYFINKENKEEWESWVIKAFQAIYGFEYQGDNLLLARINLFNTFCDYYKAKFGKYPSMEENDNLIKEIAEIISWNLWQMDGIDYCIPQEPTSKISLSKKRGKLNNSKNDGNILASFGINNPEAKETEEIDLTTVHFDRQFCIIKDWFNQRQTKENKVDWENILYFDNVLNIPSLWPNKGLNSDDLKRVGKLQPIKPKNAQV